MSASPLLVKIPSSLEPATMHVLLTATIDAQLRPRSPRIALSFKACRFAESSGVTLLSNLIEWLRSRGVDVTYVDCDRGDAGVSYLDDVGFFSTYWGTTLSPVARLRSTTYPFRRLTCADSHQWVDGNVFPWLADKLNVAPSALYEFKSCIRELFNNIDDHSTEQIGCMHVQWHPNTRRVKIAISDFGIGIPTEVRKVVPGITDWKALEVAVVEGFSSKQGRNKGAGLSYLIDNVVRRNKGSLGIYSGEGRITFSHSANGPNSGKMLGVYPGTLVNIILRTDTLRADDEGMEDVSW